VRSGRTLAAFGCALGLAAGCAAPWSLDALEARTPGLAAVRGHRLGDVTPYLLPRDDELVLFLCRFEQESPLRVALPEDATPDERALLELALQAWSGAGLGVVLEPTRDAERADISIRIGGAAAGFAAQTAAECGLLADAASGPTLPARLVSAQVMLRRADRDVFRHPVPLSREEFLGSALHELGHALGFQGHVRRSGSVMVRNVEAVRHIGRRLLAGQRFHDATLEALYRVESGAVLDRRPLSPGRTESVDRLLAIARTHDFTGPFVRVGDRSGRLTWWDGDGRRLVVAMPDLPQVLSRSDTLSLVPGPVARVWLRSKREPSGRSPLSPGWNRARVPLRAAVPTPSPPRGP